MSADMGNKNFKIFPLRNTCTHGYPRLGTPGWVPPAGYAQLDTPLTLWFGSQLGWRPFLQENATKNNNLKHLQWGKSKIQQKITTQHIQQVNGKWKMQQKITTCTNHNGANHGLKHSLQGAWKLKPPQSKITLERADFLSVYWLDIVISKPLRWPFKFQTAYAISYYNFLLIVIY